MALPVEHYKGLSYCQLQCLPCFYFESVEKVQ